MNAMFYNNASYKLSPQNIKHQYRKAKAERKARERREQLDSERISAHDRAVRVARYSEEL